MHIDSFALPSATNLIDVHWNWAAKIDLKDAFLHFPASEKLMQHQCFEHKGEMYAFSRMIWGTKIAPWFLQSFTSVIRTAVTENFPKVRAIVYMDDFVMVGEEYEEVAGALNYLRNLLSETGFTISQNKSSKRPERHLPVLGYYLKDNALWLDTSKFARKRKLKDQINQYATVHRLQTLLGILQHDAFILPGVRGLVRALQARIPQELSTSRDRKMRNKKILLSAKYRRKLN